MLFPFCAFASRRNPMSSVALFGCRAYAWSRAPQETRGDSCVFVKVQQPLCHPRLENTDALKQRMRFVRFMFVSQSMFDHFLNTAVAFCSLRVIAEPLLLQRWNCAPTSVIVSDHGIEGLSMFREPLGERTVLVQKVFSMPVSRPAPSKPTMHSFTISSKSFSGRRLQTSAVCVGNTRKRRSGSTMCCVPHAIARTHLCLATLLSPKECCMWSKAFLRSS